MLPPKLKIDYFVSTKPGEVQNIELNGGNFRRILQLYQNELKKMNVKEDDFLFYGKNGKKMNQSSVKYILKEKFKGKNKIYQISCHSFRKFAGRLMFEAGVKMELISKRLNHYNPSCTYTYLSVTPNEMQKATECLAF